MIQRAWRSPWLNRTLLVLAVLVSAATVVILGFLVYLYFQGYSGGNDPTSVAPLAFLFAIALYGIVGIPAQLICALLWVAYATSRVARKRAR
jgi:ABC-type polysaccharide/polyol phosphate export permease